MSSETPASLSESVQHRLSAYALAATAAGVSAIALVTPTEGKIIYTKTNVDVFRNKGDFPLDLNHDGKADFLFVGFATCWDDCSFGFSSLQVAPAFGNAIWLSATSNPRGPKVGAAALSSGVRVGPKAPLAPRQLLMGYLRSGDGGYWGPWQPAYYGVGYRYLGLEFKIKGKTHYGWARLNFVEPGGATLTGYAYETIPNKPIITGKTKGPDVSEQPSLGHLARGAAGH